MAGRVFKIGLVGAGMFGGETHLRTYVDLQREGIAPALGRVGLGRFARDLSDVEFRLVGIATHTERSANRAAEAFEELTGCATRPYFGETPWVNLVDDNPDMDLLAIATPDNLHTPPALCALRRGINAIVEKPMALNIDEADQLIEESERRGLILAIDMHKRYDPDHIHIFKELSKGIGKPIYARALLEEPLEVSTSTFKWATQSDPFSYVGVHWTDLFIHYLKIKPVSLYAVGQKEKLIKEYNIDAYDSVQVSVIFDNGMNIYFENNWITPKDFEGPVNQESRLVATRGAVESDSQYRGLRYWGEGLGSRTANTHFQRYIENLDGSQAYMGYGKDSLIVGIVAALRRKFMNAKPDELRGTYPDAREGRLSVAIIHAAREVRDRNYRYIKDGKGAPVTAHFGPEGITILDPYGRNERIYDRPI
ncbi:MAG: Gfo/Idh/MocA family protein [bacterium]